ncbi:MAG: class I SAM-dependent methyltransferase [Hyphomicrobiales bacterium]|nr:class I SAM-dependent methyltransferase [Hyphomicrobiales bacterium]MCP5373841.1 class I SAM-dependent methyltransferase [Hyphomicrobiales bacterium]
MLFGKLLDHLIQVGTLTVYDSRGREHVFRGPHEGPSATIRLHDRALEWRLFFSPDLVLGEAYTDGRLTVEDGGDLYGFMKLVGMNLEAAGHHPVAGWRLRLDSLFRRFHQFNALGWARANVAHHYDLSGELYDLFLDRDRQYSCAYFPDGVDDLDVAQDEKKRHIAAKLQVRPGQRVLDIGSGWGGMALHLARTAGADVTGVTLSVEQLNMSQKRAAEAGLADRARFFLRDYRKVDSQFDRIVSVGMFEHVGVSYYRTYFNKVRELLADDGVAVLHTIGRMEPPGATNPWIRKYIFPGGYIPALSEVVAAIEKARLWITDVEVLRLHYAETLRHWRQRFMANRDKALALYDERFCRMWEFYLVGSEISFRHMGNVVFQIQMARRQDAVPLTRSYIEDSKAPASGGQSGSGDSHRAA